MLLEDIYKLFPNKYECIFFLQKIRWDNTPYCPYCKSIRNTPLKNELRFHCNSCNTSFSVTVNTIFHNSKMPLQKWFFAIFKLLVSDRNISARQLSKDLKINKNSGAFLITRISHAMLDNEQRQILVEISKLDLIKKYN